MRACFIFLLCTLMTSANISIAILIHILKKLATPQATLTHLSCSPNFPRASYLDECMLTYEPIVHYIISSVMQAFWLVLTHDLLEDWHIDDVIIKTFFNSLLYKTNRFQVAVRLFSNRSQRTSTCGKNISDTLGCATFLFLPYFDIICDQLLNRHMATWNLFVKQKNSNMESIYLFYNTLTWVGKTSHAR